MYQNYQRQRQDPAAPYQPGFHGTYEYIIEVGGKKRRMLAYAPADIRESTAGLLVLGENGKSADDLLQDSGWKEIAEQEECKEKLIVFFLEPEDGTWHIDEPYGCSDGDVAYIDAAAQQAVTRFWFCVHESKLYLTGCRAGGILANMAAMWNPAHYAGVVSVGGSAVSADYLAAAQTAYCDNLDGYQNLHHELDIRKGEIPLPAWVIDDPVTETGSGNKVLEYWKRAAGVEDSPRRLNPDQVEFVRQQQPDYAMNREKEAYRVCWSSIAGSSADDARRLQRRIWKDFLYRQRRWMSSPGGDLRVTKDPVRDLGMDYYYEEVDGWKREWYVYVPEKVKNGTAARVPLVLAMHGYTCSGEIYAGNSEWYKVADKHGFIVIHPTALYGQINMENNCIDPNFAPLPAWNVFAEADRPDELKFFNYLLDRTIAEYPVDPERVYATGHSWGSLMTQMLALAIPGRFAAVAPCSGVFFGGAEKRMLACSSMRTWQGLDMPVWMFCGEKEGFLIDAVPTNENVTGFNISLWLKNNRLDDQIPVDWSSHEPVRQGRWINRFFARAEVPLVRFTAVAGMPHATMTEMSFKIWEEFFAGFSRRANGDIEYHNV